MSGTDRNSPASDRYRRHQDLLDGGGWQRLHSVTAVVAGVGGLGSHVLSSLARLGPLRLELWDPGMVDAPDLNRQILYTPDDMGQRKVDAAARRLGAINRDLHVATEATALTARSFRDRSTAKDPLVIFDCLDSFAARGALEEIRSDRRCPVFHGGVEGWYGQATTLPADGPGYPEVFGPDYATMPAAGKPILPTTVAAIAAMQVSAFIGWCLDPARPPLVGSLLIWDGRSMTWDTLTVHGEPPV